MGDVPAIAIADDQRGDSQALPAGLWARRRLTRSRRYIRPRICAAARMWVSA